MSWTSANQISSLYSQGISIEYEQRKQLLGGGLTFILSSGNLFELDGTANLTEGETRYLHHDCSSNGLLVLRKAEISSVMGKPPTPSSK